jgi:hypothetical protein
VPNLNLTIPWSIKSERPYCIYLVIYYAYLVSKPLPDKALSSLRESLSSPLGSPAPCLHCRRPGFYPRRRAPTDPTRPAPRRPSARDRALCTPRFFVNLAVVLCEFCSMCSSKFSCDTSFFNLRIFIAKQALGKCTPSILASKKYEFEHFNCVNRGPHLRSAASQCLQGNNRRPSTRALPALTRTPPLLSPTRRRSSSPCAAAPLGPAPPL